MKEVDDIIRRVKLLHEYEVTVTINGTMMFNGRVPYDVHIEGDKATIRILAESHEEANQKATEFINGITS